MTQTADTGRRLHYAWVVALVGGIAVFCGLGLGRFAFGMMLPSMSVTLDLNYTQAGILGFGNLSGYLTAVLLIPKLIGRIGTRATVVSGLALMALSMFAMGLTREFTWLTGFYFLTGLGSGAVVVPSMSVMSKWFAPSHRGISSGLVMSGAGFGIILSGFAVPRLAPFHGMLAWQTGWLIFGVITALIAVIALTYIRNHPDDMGSTPFGRTIAPNPSGRTALSRQTKVWLVAHLGLVYAIYGVTYMLYVTFIVTSMIDSYDMDASAAGSLWSWFGFLSIFSGLLFGGLSDRIGRRAGMAVAFAVLTVAFALVGFSDWIPGLYISVMLFGIAAWSIPVIIAACAGDYFGPMAAASALAALTLCFSAGQALGPVLAGLLAERYGDFSSSYALSAMAALLAVALVSIVRPPVVAD